MTRTKEKKASRERRFCLQRMIVAFVVNSYFWPGVWTDRTFEWNGIPVNVTDKGEYVVDTDAVFTSLKDDAMGNQQKYLMVLSKWKAEDDLWNIDPTAAVTFADLKKRIDDDFRVKFDGSAWFGGTSPFHKFQSKCFFALGSYRENACIFKDIGRIRNAPKCEPKHDEFCGESLLPGCWHGSARAKKEGTVSTSLTCNPMARNHYTPGMLPEDKDARRNAAVVVMNYVMETVEKAFKDFEKHYGALLKKANVRRHSIDTTKPKIVAAIKELRKAEQGGTPSKTLVDDGLKVLIPDVVHPKDAFWNIFADEKINPKAGDPAVQMAKTKRTQGYIDLCTYFANALKDGKEGEFQGTGTLEDKIGQCFDKTKKPIPELCIQNFAPTSSNKEEQEAYANWLNFKEFIHKPEQHDVWKLFKFATQDSIHSKFKGCYCFTKKCNTDGFDV